MLFHRRVTPSVTFASTQLHNLAQRGNVKVKFLAQEDNTMSMARSQTGSYPMLQLTLKFNNNNKKPQMPLSENYKTHHENQSFIIAKISFHRKKQTKNIANPNN